MEAGLNDRIEKIKNKKKIVKEENNQSFNQSNHQNKKNEEQIEATKTKNNLANSITSTTTSDSIMWNCDMTKNDTLLELPADQPAFTNDSKNKCDYNVISKISSSRKPDIYVGDQVIKAKQYRVQSVKEDSTEDPLVEESRKLIEENMEDEMVSGSDELFDYEELRKKDARYFLVSNITIKCFNCDEVGHISRNCPNELVLHTCIRCHTKGHNELDCPNVKCFKCNKIGHKSFECKMKTSEIIKCENCKNIGHEAEDCLIEPKKIKKSVVKNSICFFCGEEGHIMCKIKKDHFIIEDYNSEEVQLSDESENEEMGSDPDPDFNAIITKTMMMNEKLKNSGLDSETFIKTEKNVDKLVTKKRRRKVFNHLSNTDIKEKIFCPKCADMHKIDECNVQMRFNTFDQRRQTYSKTFFRENREDGNANRFVKNEREVRFVSKNRYDDGSSDDIPFEELMNGRNNRIKTKQVKKEKFDLDYDFTKADDNYDLDLKEDMDYFNTQYGKNKNNNNSKDRFNINKNDNRNDNRNFNGSKNNSYNNIIGNSNTNNNNNNSGRYYNLPYNSSNTNASSSYNNRFRNNSSNKGGYNRDDNGSGFNNSRKSDSTFNYNQNHIQLRNKRSDFSYNNFKYNN